MIALAHQFLLISATTYSNCAFDLGIYYVLCTQQNQIFVLTNNLVTIVV